MSDHIYRSYYSRVKNKPAIALLGFPIVMFPYKGIIHPFYLERVNFYSIKFSVVGVSGAFSFSLVWITTFKILLTTISGASK